MCLKIVLQLVVLFGEVVKPLGGGTLLKKVCYWVKALGFYSLASLPFLSLL